MSRRLFSLFFHTRMPARYVSTRQISFSARQSSQTHELSSSYRTTHFAPRRKISSNSSSSRSKPSQQTSSSSSKPIVLDQPDKFRPPSHASRLKARSTTAMYGAGSAYNQGMTGAEREASRQKRYPHMFPNEGTTLHWFLTTRWVHVTITLVS